MRSIWVGSAILAIIAIIVITGLVLNDKEILFPAEKPLAIVSTSNEVPNRTSTSLDGLRLKHLQVIRESRDFPCSEGPQKRAVAADEIYDEQAVKFNNTGLKILRTSETFYPRWTVLYRCERSGTCLDSSSWLSLCSPMNQTIVELVFQVYDQVKNNKVGRYMTMYAVNHTECKCSYVRHYSDTENEIPT